MGRSHDRSLPERRDGGGDEGSGSSHQEGPLDGGSSSFSANGFEIVGSVPPDYELLFRKFTVGAANPVFKSSWEEKAARYGRVLTIIRSGQCPYIAKFAAEIAETAEQEYGVKAKTVAIKSWREAQNAPTPYAVFALIYKGRLVADHQISPTRFRNIMKKCVM